MELWNHINIKNEGNIKSVEISVLIKQFKNTVSNYYIKFKKLTKRYYIICDNCKKYKAYHIHHLNKNTKDNSIQNLQMLCRQCHLLIHNPKKLNSDRLMQSKNGNWIITRKQEVDKNGVQTIS
jgi:5-methylcytosine-specific restriction endonuclease McrA